VRSLRRRAVLGALAAAAGGAVAGACAPSAQRAELLSEAPLTVRPAATATPLALPLVRFPEDEGPHNVLAEWWYYTGHLYADAAAGEQEFGFELVIFRGIRGDRPPGYAAHFAVTDLARGRFVYDQRQDVALNENATGTNVAAARIDPSSAAQAAPAPRPPGIVSLAPAGGGFDLALGGWWLRGALGHDRLLASMPGYGLDLQAQAVRPPALHLGDPPWQPGLISFGPAGYSYYYSRTRMEASGTLTVDGAPLRVHGEVWMDHQWGDFLVLGGGGWDWFAANLRDGRDLTFSLIRNEQGQTVLGYGTLVTAAGESRHLPPAAFTLAPTGSWTSPRTGITYPSGWRLTLPGESIDLLVEPLLPDQELDTRASTGVIYWEGAVRLLDAATRADQGRGYVELTGYTASRQ
jgi:predicted secreted hydrolase